MMTLWLRFKLWRSGKKGVAILAHESTGLRGDCYTVINKIGMPVGMVYERDNVGEPTEGFDKLLVL